MVLSPFLLFFLLPFFSLSEATKLINLQKQKETYCQKLTLQEHTYATYSTKPILARSRILGQVSCQERRRAHLQGPCSGRQQDF